MPRRFAEYRVVTQEISVAEHVCKPRLHQRGAPVRLNGRAERIQALEEAPGGIENACEPEAADVVD